MTPAHWSENSHTDPQAAAPAGLSASPRATPAFPEQAFLMAPEQLLQTTWLPFLLKEKQRSRSGPLLIHPDHHSWITCPPTIEAPNSYTLCCSILDQFYSLLSSTFLISFHGFNPHKTGLSSVKERKIFL